MLENRCRDTASAGRSHLAKGDVEGAGVLHELAVHFAAQAKRPGTLKNSHVSQVAHPWWQRILFGAGPLPSPLP